MRKLPYLALFLLVPAALAGCDDDLDFGDWVASEVEVRLWSVDRGDSDYIGFPSAYDFVGINNIPRRVVVESPGEAGNWDVIVTESTAGLELTPADAFSDLGGTGAGIAVIEDRTFEEVEVAPGSDAEYTITESVPMVEGGVYVVRSRSYVSLFGGTCRHYAKLEILEADLVTGSLVFKYTRNPNCNDRALVPPKSDD